MSRVDVYKLVAVLDGRRQEHWLRQPRVEAGFEGLSPDLRATIAATAWIINAAHRDQSGPWSLGEIDLYDPRGVVIHHMDAKPSDVSW